MSHHQILKKKESQLAEKERECDKLYKQIKGMRRHHGLSITDHAVVRHLERVNGLQIQLVYDVLITPQVKKYYDELGDGTYPTGNGNTRVVIVNGVIVTVIN